MSKYNSTIRNNDNDDNYSTAFPLLVIGGTMAAIIAYLTVGSSLLAHPPRATRVYVQVAETPVNRPLDVPSPSRP
jgi:predicted permease